MSAYLGIVAHLLEAGEVHIRYQSAAARVFELHLSRRQVAAEAGTSAAAELVEVAAERTVKVPVELDWPAMQKEAVAEERKPVQIETAVAEVQAQECDCCRDSEAEEERHQVPTVRILLLGVVRAKLKHRQQASWQTAT